MTAIPPTGTALWYEYQYNPRVTVENAASIISDWRRRALATRERYPPHSDFKYGAHPRENYDLIRAARPRGTVIYIHGGYWRMLSKLETTWIADAFVEQGLSVALINYPLCPDVSLAHIRESVTRAFAHLWSQTLEPEERNRIAVIGHSAGGHLAAHHLTIEWRAKGLPRNPITAVLSVSGVFDVAPLIHTSMNADLRLTTEIATPLNLITTAPRNDAKLSLAVGENEPAEFHRQSQDLVTAWQNLAPELLTVANTNHFTIIDSLALKGGTLNAKVLEMLEL